MTQHPPEGQDEIETILSDVENREEYWKHQPILTLTKAYRALRSQAQQDKQRIAEMLVRHQEELKVLTQVRVRNGGKGSNMWKPRAMEAEKRVKEQDEQLSRAKLALIDLSREAELNRKTPGVFEHEWAKMKAELAAKEKELTYFKDQMKSIEGGTLAHERDRALEKVAAQSATIAGYANAMKRIKAEAYGEKSWAFVVDQIAQIEIKTPSDLTKEHEAIMAVVEAAKNLCPSEGAWKDEPRMDYDEVQIDKRSLKEFNEALSRLSALRGGGK